MEENGAAWEKLVADNAKLEELCLERKICERTWSAEELPETRYTELYTIFIILKL